MEMELMENCLPQKEQALQPETVPKLEPGSGPMYPNL